MKTSPATPVEFNCKTSQVKLSKKPSKSRAKSSKSENGSSTASKNGSSSSLNSNTPTASSSGSTSGSAMAFNTMPSFAGFMDSSTSASPFGNGSHSSSSDNSTNSKSQQKTFGGLEPRSVRIIWEQHDQSDVELSPEVCARVAEDASYKLWELVNNIKKYARHSGGTVTYDLVNEVLHDCDVPPALGAMDTDWDRINYDGTFYFYSDKVIELREEYQKDVVVQMPTSADYECSWPVEDENMEYLRKYIPSFIYAAIYGNQEALENALDEVAFSPIIGSCYRVILTKVIQMLAFKQSDPISERCWRLLRACAFNPYTRHVSCREEYFHLAEILVCQLLATYESIKLHKIKPEIGSEDTIKMESDESKFDNDLGMKLEYTDAEASTSAQEPFHTSPISAGEEEKIYKLQVDDDDDFDMQEHLPELSPYFASPVEYTCVEGLCQTLGQLAANNGYFQSECLFHIMRRLERFFDGRELSTEREYFYVMRAVRCLISLGEYAFREFLQYVYKLPLDEIPEVLWNDFAVAAVFLGGPDDIFFYEWLEYVCGGDMLQPYMLYYTRYYEKYRTSWFQQQKKQTFQVVPKVTVRRLEWSTLAAAMCHGDDPNRELKPKPTLEEVFPKLVKPTLKLTEPGRIRFNVAGFRPLPLKSKAKRDVIETLEDASTTEETLVSDAATTSTSAPTAPLTLTFNLNLNLNLTPTSILTATESPTSTPTTPITTSSSEIQPPSTTEISSATLANTTTIISPPTVDTISSLLNSKIEPSNDATTSSSSSSGGLAQSDILIARRRLYKPLSNGRRPEPVSSYHNLKIN